MMIKKVIMLLFLVSLLQTGYGISIDSLIIFRFVPNDSLFYAARNKNSIQSLTRLLEKNKAAIEAGHLVINIRGYCNLHSTPEQNRNGAKIRSNQVKSYFIVKNGLHESYFRTRNETTFKNNKSGATVLAFITPVGQDLPEPQPQMIKEVLELSPLSSGQVPFLPTTTRIPKENTRAELPLSIFPVNDKPKRILPSVDPSWPVFLFSPTNEYIPLPAVPRKPQRHILALKTNIPLLAATIANLEAELGFRHRYSFNFSLVYSPYTIKRNFRLRVLMLQPEFRYWFTENTKGHFLGIHTHIGWFNLSTHKTTRYQDSHHQPLVGIGLNYGYVLPVCGNWSAEFTLGGGYAHIEYDSFYNLPNGDKYSQDIRNYWGITRLGISIVYHIKFCNPK